MARKRKAKGRCTAIVIKVNCRRKGRGKITTHRVACPRAGRPRRSR